MAVVVAEQTGGIALGLHEGNKAVVFVQSLHPALLMPALGIVLKGGIAHHGGHFTEHRLLGGCGERQQQDKNE